MALGTRDEERRPAIIVELVDAGVMVEQQTYDSEVASVARDVQRGVAVLVELVDVAAVAEKHRRGVVGAQAPRAREVAVLRLAVLQILFLRVRDRVAASRAQLHRAARRVARGRRSVEGELNR